MARIRTIKPEFWTSESVGRLTRDARLLFIALWSLADDSGRLRGSLPYLSGAAFPYDDDARDKVGSWLDQLERYGMARRYTGSDGNTYIDIPKWSKHQKIEKPSQSKIPPFSESSTNTPRILPEGSPLDQGSRTIGSRTKDQEAAAAAAACEAPAAVAPQDLFEGSKPIPVKPSVMLRTWQDWKFGKRIGMNRDGSREVDWIAAYDRLGWDELTKGYEYFLKKLTDRKHVVWANQIIERITE